MLKTLLICALAVLPASPALASQTAQPTYVPSSENVKAREEFSQKRFGIFIHWGIYSMMGRGEWALQVDELTHDEYSRLAAGFNPSKFDATAWARVFKASGAKYICITSRHHDGFSMYATKASDYNIVDATPFGRDVLKELSDACAAEGLGFNIYYSILDWGRNDYWPLGRTGHKTGRPEGSEGDWDHYHDFMDQQLTELLTGYGKVGAIWLDGYWDKDMYSREELSEIWKLDRHYSLIHSLQPSCLVGNNHHVDVNPGEDIQIFERDIPGHNEGGYSGDMEISKLPLETCQTMNWSWGYRMKDLDYKSVDYLIQYLVRTAGKGANLLLNIGPRPDGTIPEQAIERLEAIGQWLETYGETIYGTEAGLTGEQTWGVSTQKANTLYLHVLESQDKDSQVQDEQQAKDSHPSQKVIEIEIPKSNRLLSAKTFTGEKLQCRQSKGKATVTLPAKEETPDQILILTFKNPL